MGAENLCDPIGAFGSGVIGAGGDNGCSSSTVLSTISDLSCDVKCNETAGYAADYGTYDCEIVAGAPVTTFQCFNLNISVSGRLILSGVQYAQYSAERDIFEEAIGGAVADVTGLLESHVHIVSTYYDISGSVRDSVSVSATDIDSGSGSGSDGDSGVSMTEVLYRLDITKFDYAARTFSSNQYSKLRDARFPCWR